MRLGSWFMSSLVFQSAVRCVGRVNALHPAPQALSIQRMFHDRQCDATLKACIALLIPALDSPWPPTNAGGHAFGEHKALTPSYQRLQPTNRSRSPVPSQDQQLRVTHPSHPTLTMPLPSPTTCSVLDTLRRTLRLRHHLPRQSSLSTSETVYLGGKVLYF